MGAGGIGALLKLRPPLPTIVSAPHQGSQGQEDRRQPQPVPQQVLHPRGSEKFPASHKPLHSTATLHRWGNRVPERNGNLLRSQVCITYKYILPREGRGASQPPCQKKQTPGHRGNPGSLFNTLSPVRGLPL